ncbi:M48 family metallopeptidase [Patescibacteria group bacterium]
MPNIYDHIEKNKRSTLFIITLFVVFISLIGFSMGEIYNPGYGLFYTGIALVFSGVSSFVSFYNSDKIVLKISKAKEVPFQANTYLHNLVDNLCIATGLPKPKIYMIDDTAMNAFATGRDPNHSVLCFTSGIVDKLEKSELEGVVAHELSHIQNYDIRLMSIVSILVGTVTLMADWFTRGALYGGRRKSSSSGGSQLTGIIFLVGIVFLLISPLIAALIKAAVSKKREYLADSSAALITRYPKALADALRKLSQDHEILEAANGATAHMYISNPLKNKFLSQLFNTHPPIEERISRLESM